MAANSAFAWWYLSHLQKRSLEQERRAGRFGGQTAKGVGRAPYYWAQEHGEPRAAIVGKHYVQDAIRRWRLKAPSIVREFTTA